MNRIRKSFIKIGLLSLLSAMPLAAQMDNGVNFSTSFPPFVENCQLGPGTCCCSGVKHL